jgi:hypothetical protein
MALQGSQETNAAQGTKVNALAPVLYMALELSNLVNGDFNIDRRAPRPTARKREREPSPLQKDALWCPMEPPAAARMDVPD